MSTTGPRGVASTLVERLPSRLGRSARVFAWLVLASNILIVATGGLVRLTGSGLGCPNWPYCTDDSLVSTPELGVHGLIEFGNRTLTVALILIALGAFLTVARVGRRDLRRLTIANGVLIIVQAVVGGVIVWLHLPPTLVGIHFVVSAALVANAAALVHRVYSLPGVRRMMADRGYVALTHVTAGAVAVTVLVGVLLTGSGPHAGDDAAARNGLDPVLWQHVHSWPAYVTLALTLLLVAGSFRMPAALHLRRWTGLLLAVELVQIAVGLAQARLGLPIVLVNIHMVLAVVLVAAMTAVVLHLRAPAPVPAVTPSLVAAR